MSDQQKQIVLKLLDYLYHEVISSGGDGDALWYSKYYKISEILPLVHEYNKTLSFPWEVRIIDNCIEWGDYQEWVTITNDEEMYKNSPTWQQCLIKC